MVYMRFAFCRECVELQQVASFIHVSCAWCQDAGFTVFSTVWFCSCFRRLQHICFFFISFQMARSREMFSELFIIHGNHSGHGIHLIGHYSWLLRFIAVFFIRWFPNYHLGKFANGFLGSLVHFYLGWSAKFLDLKGLGFQQPVFSTSHRWNRWKLASFSCSDRTRNGWDLIKRLGIGHDVAASARRGLLCNPNVGSLQTNLYPMSLALSPEQDQVHAVRNMLSVHHLCPGQTNTDNISRGTFLGRTPV